MGSELRVAVAGATGALGGEIVKVLDGVSWRPDTLVALARQTTSVAHVDYGDARVPVDVAEDEDALDGVDALFVALPPDAARPLIETASRQGILTVDCSGVMSREPAVPLIAPWVNPEALASVTTGVVAIPEPASLLLASVLGPLRRAGLTGPAEAVVLVPASTEGKAGIEELSRQVVALFNTAPPPRKTFREGLAFDLLPSVGTVGDDGWTHREHDAARQTARVAELSDPVDVALVGVPVFSGVSAHAIVHLRRNVPIELALRILSEGGVQVPEASGTRYLPRPRRVEGKPFAHVGRVRLGADGRALHLWLSMDNLRTVATAAVATAGALLRGGGQLAEPVDAGT